MVRVDLRKAESDDVWRETVGQAIETVRLTARLSLKEFADKLGRDERQVARWINAKEHAQIAVIFAVAEFREALVVALAQAAGGGVEIETTVRIRRRA